LAGSDQFKKDVEALIARVLERHEAITSKVKALTETALSSTTTRMDDVEKKLNRGKLGGGWGLHRRGHQGGAGVCPRCKVREA
jgi:hypothetical protein